MKKFLRKFITLVLAFALVLGAVPAAVFANSGGSSSSLLVIDYTAHNEDMQSNSTATGLFPGGFARTESTANTDLYLLAVSLGEITGKIAGVVVSYYTSASDTVPYRQVLEVNRVDEGAQTLASIEKGGEAFLELGANWPFYGSKFSTYRALVGTASKDGSSQLLQEDFSGNQITVQKHFSAYQKAAKAVVPDLNEKKYLAPYEKYGSSDKGAIGLLPNSTEYIEFRLQYQLYKIHSVSFILEQSSTGGMTADFIISGWSIIKLDQSMCATNYAYVSDKLGLSFNGSVICQSTKKSNEKLKDGVSVTQNGVITYFNKSVLPTTNFDSTKEDYTSQYTSENGEQIESDTYRSDILGGSYTTTLCCTDNKAEIEDLDTPSVTKLDFVITFADEYGAGIEEFNVSPVDGRKNFQVLSDDDEKTTGANSGEMLQMNETGLADDNPLSLSDVLDAKITYLDNKGLKQVLSLPIISNSLLNATIDSYETGIGDYSNSTFVQDIKSGSFLEYAQQGQSISFSVEIPAYKELTSISISYFDPRTTDDAQIAISSIAVYDSLDKIRTDNSEAKAKLEAELATAQADYNKKKQALTQLEKELRDLENEYKFFQIGYMPAPYFSGMQRTQTAEDKKFIELRSAVSNKKNEIERYRERELNPAESKVNNLKKQLSELGAAGKLPVPFEAYYDYKVDSANSVISALPTGANLVYISDQSREEWIGNGSNEYEFKFVSLADIPAEDRTIPVFTDYSDTYIATIKTDSVLPASTRGDVEVTFEYRKLGTDGEYQNMEAGPFDIKESIQNYEGYNIGAVLEDTLEAKNGRSPLATDKAFDMAYYKGMFQNGELSFLFKARDAVDFTGVKFKMQASEDDWQVDSVSIARLEDMSTRRIIPTGFSEIMTAHSNDGDLSFATNRSYDRVVYGTMLASATDMSLLLQGGVGGSEAHYSFVNGDTSGSAEKRIDDSEWTTEMPFEVAANMTHGYATDVQDYEVRVKVGANSQYAAGGDTCGSNNMFYFQLHFRDKQGNTADSSYVLANRQLAADGFRSGVTESFKIATNKDYGDVVGISIIPDDISSNSDPLDKLCVDEISVIKKNDNAPDKRFVFENIGWISTEFRDTSEMTEKERRTESEMALSYKTAYSAYMVNLEVAITWGSYQGDEGQQFVGDMTCDLIYETSNGSQKTLSSLPVVAAMYEYRNKTAPIDAETGKVLSDSSTMFKDNTIDRFMISVEDCYQINRIIFHATPKYTIDIPFKAIEISVLRSDGTLAYSADQTYIRKYNKGMEPILVAQLESTPTKTYSAVYGQQNNIPFYLSSTPLPEFDDDATYESIPERVPLYGEDTINILYYLTDDTPFPSEAGYVFTGEVRYSKSDNPSATYTIKTVAGGGQHDLAETRINGKKVLAVFGVPTQGISTINSSVIRADDITADYRVSNIVVQQVRDNTIIDTKTSTFGSGKFSQEKGAASLQFNNVEKSTTKQEFTLMLGEGTPEMTLVEGKQDVAIQLKYKAKTVDRNSYNSPIIFATDASDTKDAEGHNTLNIHAGSVLKFDLNEYDFSDVEQVTIKTVAEGKEDGFKVVIGNTSGYAGATLVCTEDVKDTDAQGNVSTTTMQTGYYTFVLSEKMPVGAIGVNITPTYTKATDANIYRRVDMTFGTQSATNSLDSAGKYPIKAEIKYMKNKVLASAIIDDIRNYISDVDGGSFDVDGKATCTFMLPGYVDIVSIKLEPVNSEGTGASWNLGTISVQADGIDKTPRTIKVDKHIEQGTPEIIMLNGQENVDKNQSNSTSGGSTEVE